MKSSLFYSFIKTITGSNRPGWGFVLDFIDVALSYDWWENNRIRHAISIWNYELNEGDECQVNYFSSSTLNLVGLNRKKLLESDHAIVNGDIDSSIYLGEQFVWHDRFIAIPINSTSNNPDYLKAKGAIIFIFELPVINVDRDKLNILHLLLNSKEPEIYNSPNVCSFMSEFRRFGSDEHAVGNKWSRINRALMHLSYNGENNRKDYGVKYASFWKLNDMGDIEEDPFVKQLDCCFEKEMIQYNTHATILNTDNHYLNYFRNTQQMDLLLCSYSEIQDSLADKEFFKKMGLDENTLTALAIPVYTEYGVSSLDVCCLYIKDVLFTPFVSLSFRDDIKTMVTKGLSLVNKEIENQMVSSLMQMYSTFTNTTSFYKEVSKYIAKYNSVDDCLIYIKSPQGELLLANEEDLNEPSSYKNKMYKIGAQNCFIPPEYTNDKNFISFLSNMIILDNESNANAILFQADTPDSLVKNAACVAVQNSNNIKETSGVIVLINRSHHNTENQIKDFDIMSVDNVSVTYLSALYLHQFDLWNKAVSRKNYLLKKLRHEIPHCTSIIGNKIDELKKIAGSKELIGPAFSSCANAIELNKNRINMLASFFAAVDYEDNKFALIRKTQNIIRILNDNLALFKEEALEKGVDVIMQIHVNKLELSISDFYPLAIVNVVNNAIRYCSRGTVVLINVFEDRIEVSDIGIPIIEKEKDLIFNDGFRGSNAKKIDVKGIGYGLHLSKRVLEAHGSRITVESDYLGEENLYLEYVIYYYLKGLDATSRERFIYSTVEPFEIGMVNKLYERISKNGSLLMMEYCNKNYNQIKRWLNKEMLFGGPAFIEMEDVWFQEPIAKVKFTIVFNN